MAPETGTTVIGNLKTQPSPEENGVDFRTFTRKTCSFSSSSSPDSPLDGPFHVDEDLKSISSDDNTPKHDRVIQLGAVNEEKPVSGSCTPKDELSDHGSPLPVSTPAVTGHTYSLTSKNMFVMRSPPTQAMERSTEEPYRIPSSVFARTKSTNPMEWSVASNESLFSIHMGNSSLSKDHLLWPSGELGPPGEYSIYNQSSAINSADCKSGEMRTEAAVRPLKAVVKESEDQNNDKSIAEGRISHISEESGNSTKSFAFPILAGDVDRGPSARIAGSTREGSNMKQPRLAAKPNLGQPEPKASEATQKAPQSKWLPCFSCCC